MVQLKEYNWVERTDHKWADKKAVMMELRLADLTEYEMESETVDQTVSCLVGKLV